MSTTSLPEFELRNAGVGPDPLSLSAIADTVDFAILLLPKAVLSSEPVGNRVTELSGGGGCQRSSASSASAASRAAAR
jgi:hypothetical protein